jgi:WD40 repeat protein/predicted  nucleic acid-binding Zn-ribbon protein
MCGPSFHRIGMMIRTLLTIGLLLVPVVTLQAEQKTGEEPKINFTDHVLPIFREHCLQCHNANDAEAGLAIDSYGALMEGGGSGDAVSAGDSSASRLYLVMTHAEEPAMPPNSEPIAAEKLEIIRKWIDGGLLENSGSKVKKRKGPSLTFTSMEGGKPSEIVMPESLWRVPVVVSKRAAASSAIASSPWAPLVAVAGQKQVALYNTDSGELEGIIPFPEGIPQVLKFSVDGGYLMVAGGTHSAQGVASLYNVKTGERLLRVGDELDTVFGADVNNDLTKIALGGPQKLVRIFDTATGGVLFDLKKHTDWVYCVDFSPDGVLVASGDRSGGLHVWEADTGRLYLDLPGHKGAIRGISWRADSNVLVSASEDGTVKLWEMNAGKQLKSFNAHGGGATGVVMAQDGRLVTCGKDKTVKLWKADGAGIATMPAFTEPALEATFSHDGTKVIGGDWNGRTVMWTVADPKQAVELSPNPPTLEAQQATLAAKIAELEKGHAAALTNQTNQEKASQASKAAHEAMIAKLAQTKSALAKATADKAAAEKLLSDLRKQKAEGDQQVKAGQAAVAAADKQLRDLDAQIKVQQKAMTDSAARRDAVAKQKESIAAQLAKVNADHDQLKASAISSLSALLDRELDVSAKHQAARSSETQVETSRKAAEQVLSELQKQLTQLTNDANAVKQQMMAAEAALQKSVAELALLPAKVEAANKEVASRVAALKEAESKLAESKDEAEKKILMEQVAKVQLELEQQKVALAAAEKAVVDQTATKATHEKAKDDLAAKIVAVEKQSKDLSAKRDAAKAQVTTLANKRDVAAKVRESFSQQLTKITGEIAAATKMKDEAVKKMAVLVKERDGLSAQQSALQIAFNDEETARKGAEARLSELNKSLATLQTKREQERAKMTAATTRVNDLATKLKGQPNVLAKLAEAVKTTSAAMPNIEKQIAEAKKNLDAANAVFAQAKASVAAAAQQVSAKRAALEGIQSELVAFRSQGQKLIAEAAATEAKAAEKRKAVEPVAMAATKASEAIAARQAQLIQMAESMAKLQAQLDELQKAQTAQQQSLQATQSNLQELESAAEEAEAEAESKQEKAKFFQSVYGA